jgi:GNAT superfamily N-acetyltransferase
MTRDEELLAINTLLLRVFKTSKFADPSYLRWQYFQAPEGEAVFTNYFEDDLCRAHYCVLPQNYLFGRTVYRMALSLNTAVDPAFRLKGLFTNLANETYAKAKEEHGIRAILGVANANSTGVDALDS